MLNLPIKNTFYNEELTGINTYKFVDYYIKIGSKYEKDNTNTNHYVFYGIFNSS